MVTESIPSKLCIQHHADSRNCYSKASSRFDLFEIMRTASNGPMRHWGTVVLASGLTSWTAAAQSVCLNVTAKGVEMTV